MARRRMQDPFGARALVRHGRRVVFRLSPGCTRAPGGVALSRPSAFHSSCAARIGLAPLRRGGDHARGRRAPRALAAAQDAARRNPVQARAGAAAGLHRRALPGGPGGHARRRAAPGRRPRQGQPARPGGPGDRPLGAGRPVRHAGGARGATPSSSSSATASATSSCAGGSRPSTNFRVVPPATGIVPPGQPGVPGARRAARSTAQGRAPDGLSPTRWWAPTRTPR